MFPRGRDMVVTQRRFVEEYLPSYLERLGAAGISYYGMYQPGQERFLGRLTYSIVHIEEGTVRVERRSTPCPD